MSSATPTQILVVDDEPFITTALVRTIARPDRRVIAVNDPQDALEIVEQAPIDLVITDKDMPGMTGHELLDRIKERHPDIPLIMLTGTPSLESTLTAINRHQVIRYLVKPWNPAELADTVRAGLERRAALVATASASADAACAASPPTLREIDRYEVTSRLGDGGTGAVYRAVHKALDRPVAIKVLRGDGARDAVARARFEREARAATRARHPRIVETLDYGHLPDGRPYLVMELVAGETLASRLRQGPLAPEPATRIARGVAEALGAAHAVGVIHRDVKPGNVFVDERDDVKLGDFGAARMIDHDTDGITRADVTIGTPHYMAPEQILGPKVDGRADLYALGCVMFRMLTGQVPYTGTDTRMILGKHLHADVPVPTSPRPLPAGLVEIVRKLMSKAPRDRYQTAADLIHDLDDVLAFA